MERDDAAGELSRKLRDPAESGNLFAGAGFKAMVPHLKSYLTDSSFWVRSNAVTALGWLKPAGIEQSLRRRLVLERDADTKVSIHFALSRLGDSVSRQSIQNWVSHHD